MIMNREEVRELQDERQSGHEPPRHDQTSFAKLETTTTTRFPGAAPTPIQAEALLWEPLSAQDYLNGAMPESDSEETLDLFQEPEGYFRPEQKPTEAQYESRRGTMTMRLVGHNPLWGHLLWQGGRTVADYLEANRDEFLKGKTVLELGAGAGLPSLIGGSNGARQVVVTDYPDPELIDNLRLNIQNCPFLPAASNVVAEPYLWGADPSHLIAHLPAPEQDQGFDLLILADVLFNHSEHAKLLLSIRKTLKKDPAAQALVFFTPYRPWLLAKDLAFFDLARSAHFEVEKILAKVMEHVMFEEDPGDEMLRRTVFGYRLRWSTEILPPAP